MKKYPVKAIRRPLQQAAEPATDIIKHAPSSFLSGTPRIRARKTRFEDGEVVSETFEAELDRNVYENSIRDAQRYFLDQTLNFINSVLRFMPSTAKPPRNRD
ncbi:MAG: hypothetical protein E6H66_20165 [Betaproteobacteria bacterium]|nr:MAG: hypothetical protein E6H66_20165 [Betaproteobacteria bacterium]